MPGGRTSSAGGHAVAYVKVDGIQLGSVNTRWQVQDRVLGYEYRAASGTESCPARILIRIPIQMVKGYFGWSSFNNCEKLWCGERKNCAIDSRPGGCSTCG